MALRESTKAKTAWADYLALGPDRSLDKLVTHYQNSTKSVPTRQLSRLKRWSADFGWQQRLAEMADSAAKEAAEREAAYRRSILEDGFGRQEERVRALKRLADELLLDLTEGEKRWVKEEKMIGSGENAIPVDVWRFNASEVEQLRGLLDDIAKEKGERKTDTLLKHLDLSKLTTEQLERLAHGDDPVAVLCG